MSDTTTIEYANHTWSPWLGCEPVSPGCAHCYASAISNRAGRGEYRRGMTRTLTKDWEKPLRWNRNPRYVCDRCGTQYVDPDLLGTPWACDNCGMAIGAKDQRILVSMCDPFDDVVLTEWHVRFHALVADTPNLTWLLLTKRPENVMAYGPLPENVWLGVSVEDQPRAEERIPILCGIPAKVKWVSYEPSLGPVDIYRWLGGANGVSWVVSGGESGFNHRKLDVDWIDSMNRQCQSAGVAHFVKQDSARFSGEQGRIPNELWKVKQFPK